MKRRNFIKSSALGVAAGTAISATAISCSSPSQSTSDYIAHYVLFWLRPDLTAAEIENFKGFFEELKAIPNLISLAYGPAAGTVPRDVVDNSFSYNLFVKFKNLEDAEVYDTHPIHLQAIEKYSSYWTKVVVHDSVLYTAL